MKSDISALGAVTNALNLGASVLSTATSAMNSVETILKQMKADLVTAQTAGTNPTQVQSDITAQQQSLISVMRSASFNGVNLLDGSTASTNIVDCFSRTASGATSTGMLTIDTTSIALGGLSGRAAGLLGSGIGASTASGSGGSTGKASDSSTTVGNYAATAFWPSRCPRPRRPPI